ncbi:hypothetical protein [Brevibacillus sp. SYSU BS000544]|uniref:hypothetical protein n=1 Tax=Brevibacillus sp. SYSU BS000544 TaxID=3416443 RepID=UPI003CE45E5E
MLRYFFLNGDSPYKLLIKALIFSLLFTLLVLFLLPMASGMILTYFYTPDIVNSYENVQYLQNEVSFGVINRPDKSGVGIFSLLLLGLGLYGLLLLLVRKFVKEKQ